MRLTRDYGMAVAQVFIALLIGTSALITYWYNEPPPYKFYERVTLTPQVEAGGKFKLHVRVFWTKSCYSKLYRDLVDSAGKLTPYVREVRPNEKGLRQFDIEALVPLDSALGKAQWRVRTEWFCNPIQRRWPLVDYLEPIDFIIVPAGSMRNGGLQ